MLKVLLIGTFSENKDEGFSQISTRIKEILIEEYEVRCIDVHSPRTYGETICFKPDIIHYICGLTIKSLLLLKIIELLYLNKPVSIVSAIRVYIRSNEIKIIKYLKPDLVLTQALKWESILNKENAKTKFLPNPVDIHKIKRSNIQQKILRRKYGFPDHKKLILHIGHIKKNRNLNDILEILKENKSNEFQFIVVGSSHFKYDYELYHRLIKAGVIVILKHIDKIEEIYSAVDIFFFPVKGHENDSFPKESCEIGSIDMPFTVLEALAIGTPVISREIDAISRLLGNQTSRFRLINWDGNRDHSRTQF